MANFKNKINIFLNNKYGADKLQLFILLLSIILFIISLMFKWWFLNLIALLFCSIAIYRFLSKNIIKRKCENTKYLKFKDEISSIFHNYKKSIILIKNTEYIKCKRCKKKIRIDKDKRSISIKCPYCNEIYYK